MRVARNRQATHQDLMKRGGFGWVLVFCVTAIQRVLTGTNELNFMVASTQTFHHAGKSAGHAIHFRRVGFSDHGDAQRALPWRQFINQKTVIGISIHVQMVPCLCNSCVTRPNVTELSYRCVNITPLDQQAGPSSGLAVGLIEKESP